MDAEDETNRDTVSCVELLTVVDSTVTPLPEIVTRAPDWKFVPLTTITMSLIARDEMGNATSIFNLMRNLGGGVGIAVHCDHNVDEEAEAVFARVSSDHGRLVGGSGH